MMKISIDTSCLLINPFSGLAEMTRNLVIHLPFLGNDYDITLFMNYFRSAKYPEKVYYPGTVNHFLRLPRRLMDWWWKHEWPPFDLYLKEMDIFHSLYIQVPPTKKIKTVLTVHDCRFLAFPELYKQKSVENWRRQMEISLNRVDMVATDSEFTKQELLTYFPFSESRVKVIHCGFSPYLLNADCNMDKANRFIDKRKLPRTYLIYIGVLDPRKNLVRLIEAIAQCRQEVNDFPDLVIVGVSSEQWFKSDQAVRARELGIIDHIHLCGEVEKDILIGLIKRAHVLCYPSLYEGFGFPPLEAMSLGVPVIAGESSSIPEVTGNAACLVDPLSVADIAKGLNRVVFDNDYRQILIKAGFHQIKKFSCQHAAAKYLSLYKEVIDS